MSDTDTIEPLLFLCTQDGGCISRPPRDGERSLQHRRERSSSQHARPSPRHILSPLHPSSCGKAAQKPAFLGPGLIHPSGYATSIFCVNEIVLKKEKKNIYVCYIFFLSVFFFFFFFFGASNINRKIIFVLISTFYLSHPACNCLQYISDYCFGHRYCHCLREDQGNSR